MKRSVSFCEDVEVLVGSDSEKSEYHSSLDDVSDQSSESKIEDDEISDIQKDATINTES